MWLQNPAGQRWREARIARTGFCRGGLAVLRYPRVAGRTSSGRRSRSRTEQPIDDCCDRDSEKSIAVLPFMDMSAEKNQEYLSDGIAEELLNLLAQVPDLKVIARTSSFAFKGKKWTSRRSRRS